MSTSREPPAAEALVLVDLQVDYFESPALQDCRAPLTAVCNALLDRAREAGSLVVEVQTVHSRDRTTWSLNMLEDDEGMVVEGTPGAERLPELDLRGAHVVEKTRDSAFYRTRLESLLRTHDVSTIALCGVSTESCIALTASDAYARDLRVVLVDDALASVDPDHHEHTLGLLAEQYRQRVVKADDLQLVTALQSGPADPGMLPPDPC